MLGAMQRRHFCQVSLSGLSCLAGPGLLAACASPARALHDDLWFGFFETGRATPDDKAAVAAMQHGHIDNFKRLFAQGRLLSAGPLADPAGTKRGIVVLRAASLAELTAYFEPDVYVRDGYLRLNAQPAVARRAMHTDGIDASRIEEHRIVLIGRAADGPPAVAAARQALLQALVDNGTLGAWYSLAQGPVAEVLLARGTDTAGLRAALAPFGGQPAGSVPAVTVHVWRQWLSPGVVGPR